MPEPHTADVSTSARHQDGRGRLGALTALVVIALGLGVAYWLLSQPPRVERRAAPAAPPPQVEVMRITPGEAAPTIQGYGRVIAARQTDVASRVAGRVTGFADGVEPGRVIEAGATIATLDGSDYQLNVRTAQAELAQAEAALASERGEQIRARSEYESLGRQLSAERRALVLREPQLRSAQAVVDSAQVALEAARLDMQRTEVTAPYRAMVQERLVGPGSEVSANTALASVVDVSHFWVRVSLPSEALAWLDTGEGNALGASVTLTSRGWLPGASRQGRVFSVLPSLEENGLLAQLLVRVDDPLALESEGPALRLGDVVNATFEATPRGNLIALPTAALRPGDRVWALDDDNRLQIRNVEVIHHGETRVLLGAGSGVLEEGQRIVVSNLGQPREGMTLRVASDPADAGEPADDSEASGAVDAPGDEASDNEESRS